jgi:hypothetical protein
MSLPNHGTLPTLWSQSHVAGPETLAAQQTPLLRCCKFANRHSLKWDASRWPRLWHDACRCRSATYFAIRSLRPTSVRLGNGWKRLGRLERLSPSPPPLIGGTGYALRRKSAARKRLRNCSGVGGVVAFAAFVAALRAASRCAFNDRSASPLMHDHPLDAFDGCQRRSIRSCMLQMSSRRI